MILVNDQDLYVLTICQQRYKSISNHHHCSIWGFAVLYSTEVWIWIKAEVLDQS